MESHAGRLILMATVSDNTTLTIEAKLTLVYCDDFYGPHLILTIGGSKVEVALTLAEIKALHQWCEVLIRAHAVKI